jgi:hypothetical protein
MTLKKGKSGQRRRRFASLLVVEVLILVAGIGLYLLPPPASWVERHYSRGPYPEMQRVVTLISNKVPIAISDLLILLLLLGPPFWWCMRLKAAGRGRRLRAMPALIFHTLAVAALALLVFQLIWGLNYSRLPLTEKLDYDSARVSDQAIDEAKKACVTQLNAASGAVHSTPWPDTDRWAELLKPSFEPVVEELGASGGITPGRIKHSLFNFYLAASGIDGFINPYGLEAVLNDKLLPVEQPFAMAHEWAHLAGFADESEANFIALLTCLRSTDQAVQYAGWLALYPNLPSTPLDQGQPGTHLQLDPRVLADLDEIDKHWKKELRPWVDSAQWAFYDRFLKANHVGAGIRSYGLFLRLMVGTRFNPNWVPVMRPPV